MVSSGLTEEQKQWLIEVFNFYWGQSRGGGSCGVVRITEISGDTKEPKLAIQTQRKVDFENAGKRALSRRWMRRWDSRWLDFFRMYFVGGWHIKDVAREFGMTDKHAGQWRRMIKLIVGQELEETLLSNADKNAIFQRQYRHEQELRRRGVKL